MQPEAGILATEDEEEGIARVPLSQIGRQSGVMRDRLSIGHELFCASREPNSSGKQKEAGDERADKDQLGNIRDWTAARQKKGEGKQRQRHE
jgi:hypothetical protein